MPSPSRKKLLLMGRSGSGKSSMRSIIFSNYSAFDTRRLGATIDVEHSQVRFLGNMTLNLWDCGGQDAFMDSYYTNQRDHIFRMVEVLIHVFDVESEEVSKDIETFGRSLKSLRYYSPDAKVFCLLHKMDLVQADKRQEVFESMAKTLEDTAKPFNIHITAFATSIWDESLYKAWSSIVCSLIPNMTIYQKGLRAFADISDAEEVILFEKTTFLVVSHVSTAGDATMSNNNNQDGVNDLDPKRFEKISNIIKTYKQSCSKMRAHLQSMYLQGAGSCTYIDTLTANTYIMVVVPTTNIQQQEEDALMVQNIKFARKWFEKTEVI